MNNLDLRREISESRLKRYEIAAQLGISETSFSRMFRQELSEEKVAQVRRAIKELLDRGAV